MSDAQLLLITNHPEQYPKDGKPEFVFLGRSNVGKSSLLNAVTKKKKLAYTSGTPGKTRAIHFYSYYNAIIVDVPGYGFAKVSKTMQAQFATMIETYLTTRTVLKEAFVLVDARHAPSADDVAMVAYLQHHQIATTIVVTKADKVSQPQRAKAFQQITSTLQVSLDQLLITASDTGEGIDALRARIR
jgi:GTP-binding protein